MSEYVMNEAEAKLVEALESGRYEQAIGQLQLDGKFCCLGVACDVSGLGSWTDNKETYAAKGVLCDVSLPPAVQAWLGWASSYADTDDGGSLSGKNDEGASFDEIAALVRAGKVRRSTLSSPQLSTEGK